MPRAFAVAAPGLEAVVADELAGIAGAHDVTPLAGGVEFEATDEALYRSNLWLRTVTRVLVRLGTIEARDFATLRKRAGLLPWERYVRAGDGIEPAVTVRHCRLYHSGAVAERIALAAADRVGGGDNLTKVVVRGEDDRFTISIDSSGELLHRRGWRTEAGEAPLRETLAAALLLLAGYRADQPIWDPTCGAGTLVVEAAAMATRRAPGAERGFAFERFPGHDAALLERLRAEARAGVIAAAAPICGSDADPTVVEVARRNAERAGVAASVGFGVAVAEEARFEGPTGLVIANPPYGRRLRGASELYRALGRAARRDGHRLALLSADPNLLRAAGRTHAVISLMNGGMRVWLALYRAPI
jgi:putative N6-adenine-specific DNA methylase